MDISIIINGINTLVSVSPDTVLKEVVQMAINQTKITEGPEAFFCVCNDYILDLNEKIIDQSLRDIAGRKIGIPAIPEGHIIYIIHNSRKIHFRTPVNPYHNWNKL